jgi:hypothetical protein
MTNEDGRPALQCLPFALRCVTRLRTCFGIAWQMASPFASLLAVDTDEQPRSVWVKHIDSPACGEHARRMAWKNPMIWKLSFT